MKAFAKKYIIPHSGNDFRPGIVRAAGLFALLLLIAGGLVMSNIHRVLVRTSDLIANVLPAVLVDLANADRAGKEVLPLKINPILEAAAKLKAEDMAAKGYFSHYSPEGRSPWFWFTQAGYDFAYAGENLAVNFDDSAVVNQAWMNSPAHRANILNNNFTEVGIATARGVYAGRETTFVVELFGRPAAPRSGAGAAAAQAIVPTRNLVAVNSTTSDGSVQGMTFVAVQDTNAVAAALGDASEPYSYASRLDRIISSPTKVLSLAYAFLSALLAFVLIIIVKTRHSERWHHASYLFVVLVVIAILYTLYKMFVFSGIGVA